MGTVAELRTQLPDQSDRLSMVLPLLLPLLASLQSLPRLVTPTDPQLDPTLLVRAKSMVYPPGEPVTLVCSPPRGEQSGGYKFFFQKWQHSSRTLLRESLESQLEFPAERGRAGSYTCAYWRWGSKGTKSFRSSSPISITVTAPELTVSPLQPVYIAGEAVTLTCSAAGAPDVSGIRFFRNVQEICSNKFPSPRDSYNHSLKLSSLSESQTGVYSCEFWKTVSGRELLSETSSPIPITVTAPLPAPQLTMSPQQPVYITGEVVTLMCSAAGAPNVSGIWFFRNNQKMLPEELCFILHSATASVRLLAGLELQNSTYSCGSWRTESGREIESERSWLVSIAVTDPPPQPALSVDPPSEVVSEGLPVRLTCTTPGDTSKRRFHFYKDGVEIFEINATEPSTGSVNISVTSILRAGPNNTVEFTCGYKRNVSGRWVPSPRSPAVNITVSASPYTQDILLTAGSALLLLGVLAALLCWCWRKTRFLKPLKSPEGSQPRAHTRDVDPRHDTKQSNERPTGAGAEQDSEVTYALIEFSALDAHRSPSKNKAQPAEEEHVLYSEVVTKPIRRQLNKEGKPTLHSSVVSLSSKPLYS